MEIARERKYTLGQEVLGYLGLVMMVVAPVIVGINLTMMLLHSPSAVQVTDVHVEAGQQVNQGDLLLSFSITDKDGTSEIMELIAPMAGEIASIDVDVADKLPRDGRVMEIVAGSLRMPLMISGSGR